MRVWTPCCFTTAGQLERMVGSINSHTYSMTSGKGGAPIAVPIKSVKVNWSRQAMFVHIMQQPFMTHKLEVRREGPNHYSASATLLENRQLAAPSGLGSFDACLFDLAPEDEPSKLQMFLQGSKEPLPGGPVWR